ncbi:carboxypeptidase regulatory-like domain-containing protein [Gammaproteobacteria bacterium]|nr:carboxypeptidase regulatory-like domain-containing protein [Gammaproteobacteria bacterium]
MMSTRKITELVLVGLIGTSLFGLTACSPDVPVEFSRVDTSALTGKVTSQAEGAMEGVIVSAKRKGSMMTVSVVSDAQGQYSFPKDRLEPGYYTVSMRAVGYDLTNPGPVELTGEPAHLDLQLTITKNLPSQLTNTEWMISAPGSFEEKQYLDDCTMCHTLQRPLNSRYEADVMTGVIQRMSAHTLNSTVEHPHFKTAMPEMISKPPSAEQIDKGRYISSINLSSADTWQFPLQTLPRPTGKATQVIMTTYELPRSDAAPHDAVLGPDGYIWYNDFVSPYIGKMDPKTGEATEFHIPIQKPGYAVGSHALDFDDDGMIYAAGMHQAMVVKFDPNTEEMETFLFPHWNVDGATNDARLTVLDPRGNSVNGLIWVNGYKGGEMGVAYQVDVETNEWTEVTHPPSAPPHNAYDVIADSQNNMYGINMDKEHVWKTDAKTLETTFYQIPTPGAGGRRGNVDAKDRLWWAQYRGNGVGMFDPVTEEITEWQMPTPWTSPYDAEFDDETYVWTGGMNNDLAVRLNVETGEFTEYLLPLETNIRHVDVQKSDNPNNLSSFWVVGQLNGRITHVEPLVP